MRGVSSIISTILLVLIVISLSGSAYLFTSGFLSSKTSKTISLISAEGNSVVILNDGSTKIKGDEIRIFVDGKPAAILNPQEINPHESAFLSFIPPSFGRGSQVLIVGPSNSLRYSIDILLSDIGNFLRNGDFEQGLENWPSNLLIETGDKYGGVNSSKVVGSLSFTSTDFIPYSDNTSVVNIEFYSKSVGTGNSKLYAGFAEYDEDRNFIEHWHVQYYENTKTTLAADLKPGDTQVVLSSSLNWRGPLAPWWERVIGFWPPGSKYPDYTYTRNIAFYSTMLGNRLNLCNYGCSSSVPWNGPTIPAGTPVANMFAGATYNYVAAANHFVPFFWEKYSGQVSGWKFGDYTNYNKFRYGTKYIKVLFLANFQQTSDYSLLLDEISVKML